MASVDTYSRHEHQTRSIDSDVLIVGTNVTSIPTVCMKATREGSKHDVYGTMSIGMKVECTSTTPDQTDARE